MAMSWRRLLQALHVLGAASNLGATLLTVVLLVSGVDSTATRLCVYVVGLPLVLLALVTGVTSALASPWGLFRHGWVVKKLVLTLVNAAVLLAVVGPGTAAGAARWATPLGLSVQLVLFVLTTVLSVYKPKGRIGGRRVTSPVTRRRTAEART
ncbi:MAG TPA: hypothetical protein VH333_09225 [Pseudonocardiaceae bacterium]|jgi:hypothetical protein|nr:hypothetical protein [Pseudonocardiaceae bacterium]